MQALVSNLTASLLLTQALTGWCWQCPCDCAPLARSTADEVATDDCCERDGRSFPDRQPPAGSGKCQLECRGFCIYLPVEKAQIDGPQLAVPLDFAAITSASEASQLAAGLCWDHTRKRVESEPPLRLHLLHQIIQI
jgi:hypothetical protein